jgi:hypothetical protein
MCTLGLNLRAYDTREFLQRCEDLRIMKDVLVGEHGVSFVRLFPFVEVRSKAPRGCAGRARSGRLPGHNHQPRGAVGK